MTEIQESDFDATNSVRLCADCEDEYGVSAGADRGDTACSVCGQHAAAFVYPAIDDSFQGLLRVARQILDAHYPAGLFTGESGDLGSRFIVALRNVCEEMSD